jgi:hypothetical protein
MSGYDKFYMVDDTFAIINDRKRYSWVQDDITNNVFYVEDISAFS